MNGLTEDYEEELKNCYKRTIDLVECYYSTALRPRFEEEPVKFETTKKVEDGYVGAKEETPRKGDGLS